MLINISHSDSNSSKTTNLVNKSTLLLVFTLVVSAIIGCEEDFEAFEEDLPFSVYGYLTPDFKRNYIRVKDLTVPLIADSTRELDATVTFEDLETGAKKILNDTIVEFEGIFFHNFMVRDTLEYERTYQIEVTQEDGPGISTTATLPTRTEFSKYHPVDRCDVPITFTIDNIEEYRFLDEVLIGYKIGGFKRWYNVPDTRIYSSGENSYSFTYKPMEIINLHLDRSEYEDHEWEVIQNECYEMEHDRFLIEYTVLSEDWFGQNIRPFNPLESPDVINGLGLVGGLDNKEFEVEIDTTKLPFCDYEFFDPAQCECPPENQYDECPPPDDE